MKKSEYWRDALNELQSSSSVISSVTSSSAQSSAFSSSSSSSLSLPFLSSSSVATFSSSSYSSSSASSCSSSATVAFSSSSSCFPPEVLLCSSPLGARLPTSAPDLSHHKLAHQILRYVSQIILPKVFSAYAGYGKADEDLKEEFCDIPGEFSDGIEAAIFYCSTQQHKMSFHDYESWLRNVFHGVLAHAHPAPLSVILACSQKLKGLRGFARHDWIELEKVAHANASASQNLTELEVIGNQARENVNEKAGDEGGIVLDDEKMDISPTETIDSPASSPLSSAPSLSPVSPRSPPFASSSEFSMSFSQFRDHALKLLVMLQSNDQTHEPDLNYVTAQEAQVVYCVALRSLFRFFGDVLLWFDWDSNRLKQIWERAKKPRDLRSISISFLEYLNEARTQFSPHLHDAVLQSLSPTLDPARVPLDLKNLKVFQDAQGDGSIDFPIFQRNIQRLSIVANHARCYFCDPSACAPPWPTPVWLSETGLRDDFDSLADRLQQKQKSNPQRGAEIEIVLQRPWTIIAAQLWITSYQHMLPPPPKPHPSRRALLKEKLTKIQEEQAAQQLAQAQASARKVEEDLATIVLEQKKQDYVFSGPRRKWNMAAQDDEVFDLDPPPKPRTSFSSFTSFCVIS